MAWPLSADLLLGGGVLLLALLLVLSRRTLSLMQAELHSLTQASRALLRSPELPLPSPRFSVPFDALWSVLICARDQIRTSHRARTLSDEAFLLTSSLPHGNTASCLISFLVTQCAPEISAAAIVRFDPTTGRSSVEASTATARLNTLLLAAADDRTAVTPGEWHFESPKSGTLLDLSLFGIHTSLFIPVREGAHLLALIWLGLPRPAECIAPERQRLIEAIVRHARSAYCVSHEVARSSAASSAQREFLLGLSHDMRAPGLSALFALRLFAAEEAVTESQRERLTVVEEGIQEQLHLLEDFLDLAKDERRVLVAHRQVISLPQALHEVLNRFRSTAKISFEIDRHIPAFVRFDPTHLRRIVGNLLTNAFQYTEEGAIAVSFQQVEKYLEIAVADTGCGVPPERREALFCEFQRLGDATRTPGVGLGLAVAKRLAEVNDGYLHYAPHQPQGSRFMLGMELAPPPSERCPLSFSHVLIVDDDPFAVGTVARLLRRLQIRHSSASTLREAEALLLQNPPDLLIADFRVGNEPITALIDRLLRDRFPLPPVIFLSGDLSLAILDRYRGKFPFAALQKPIDEEGLSAAVGSL